MGLSNWKKMIEDEAGDDTIIACTLSDDELVREFSTGYGGA